jgi:hypothetical protein
MRKENRPEKHQGQSRPSSSLEGKKKWQEPKLTFIKPKLIKHGKLAEVTGQFFGAFSPGQGGGGPVS